MSPEEATCPVFQPSLRPDFEHSAAAQEGADGDLKRHRPADAASSAVPIRSGRRIQALSRSMLFLPPPFAR
jgi:hypothetical protein